MPIEDYHRLEAQAEELSDIHAFADATAASEERFPDWVAQRLIAGEHPARVDHAYRRLSLAELAQQTGLSRSYLPKIESGGGGSVSAFKAVADALSVTVDDLVD